MDVLENYKKVWGNQPEEVSKFSAIEIYRMAHSKSSSIVKWIFIIGILEFIVLNSLYFLIDMEQANKEYEKLGLENFVFYSQITAYVILFYFLWMFYQNYKRISTVDSTKILMKKILKTRKTVRNYVLFNLSYLALIMLVVTIVTINNDFEDLTGKQIFIIIVSTLIATLLFLGILWLFYQLIYGILLKKLNKNYKELAKLDTSI
ncbi:hypothetical protein [Polaribacter sp. R77954]|uniref:hypothetical protein n=1 Tax=Polaribacter sp. R77954 TaxID=3093870 RepID=UPI0037CAA091